MSYGLKTTHEAAKGRVSVLVMGESGAGKTSLVKSLPRESDREVLYVGADPGQLVLRDNGFLDFPIGKYEDIQRLMRDIHIIVEEYGIKWVVIDGLDEIGGIMYRHFEDQEARNPSGKGSKPDAFRPWAELAKKGPAFIKYMRDVKAVSTLFITHDEFDANAGCYVPAFPGKAVSSVLSGLFDEVGHRRIIRGSDDKAIHVLQFSREDDLRYMTKDRSGALSGLQEPDMAAIYNKIHTKLSDDAQDEKE